MLSGRKIIMIIDISGYPFEFEVAWLVLLVVKILE